MDIAPKPSVPEQNQNLKLEKGLSPIERDKKIREIRVFFGRKFTTSGIDSDYKKLEELMEEIANRDKYLRGKYPDYLKHTIAHAFIGSTVNPRDIMTEDDFLGEDSIVLFFNKLVDKYL